MNEDRLDDEALADADRGSAAIFAGPIGFLKSAPRAQIPAGPDGRMRWPSPAARTSAKSSLLNALTNRNTLARTSNTPGRTQELNFFDVGRPAAALPPASTCPAMALPTRPRTWCAAGAILVNDYLRGRAVLAAHSVLIDSRHGLKDVDRDVAWTCWTRRRSAIASS